MPLNTLTVAAVATPTVIGTWFSHYFDRKSFKGTPKAHLSYHEGVELIRKFLLYASHHTIEQVQAFTSRYVPHPAWVHVEEFTVPKDCLDKSAEHLITQLGPGGIAQVGGKNWWRWRLKELTGEWVEMRKDYRHRLDHSYEMKKTMLYVHGGAYFFGSVDEHRYQLQRHARKLSARVFAPRYRLAPQFPFPCAMYDVLATYLYLLTLQDPETIILAGDSAGGGLILSLLVILRDQGLPLPAGAVLISPWVDLCHSFPSVTEDNSRDFIPSYGFHQKPSPAWPPPTDDDIAAIRSSVPAELPKTTAAEKRTSTLGFIRSPESAGSSSQKKATMVDRNLSIAIDGDTIKIKDQIQMYTTNALISHPLVSPVNQGSLGGLPPLLILTGGGEILRDEQIYIAHKAATPHRYPTWPGHLEEDETGRQKASVGKYPPTKVWLQVYDDCCHVTPTLSFTRPAKFMYRSIAHFGAWAMSQATNTIIEVVEDDDLSIISSSDSSTSSNAQPSRGEDIERLNQAEGEEEPQRRGTIKTATSLNVPAFKNSMIRQRIDRRGGIYDLPHPSSIPALQMAPEEIGVIKQGPVKRWMTAKEKWDTRFAGAKRDVQKRRAKEMETGYVGFEEGETPPPSAAAGRQKKQDVVVEGRGKRSWGLGMWSSWGGSHDQKTMKREVKAEKAAGEVPSAENAPASAPVTGPPMDSNIADNS